MISFESFAGALRARGGTALFLVGALGLPLGCSSTSSAPGEALPAGDAQTPPTGGAAVEAWLHGGAYEGWHCEAQKHGPRSPSIHGLGRICVNDALAGAAAASQPWPVGAAAVEELFHLATDASPDGYAVYVKTGPDAEDDGGWYWYARVPTNTTRVAHDSRGIVADGFGNEPSARSGCVACHAAAGSDPEHTPSVGGRRPSYTPAP
jgi:hypothetical protein